MDLATSVDISLIDQRPQKIPSTFKGPLIINGQSQGALLIGRSSSGMKGLTIIPGLIDADYKGIVQIMVQTLFPPIFIPKGSQIAQLIPLPQLTKDMTPALSSERGGGGFGSTGPAVMLTMSMSRRPTASVRMESRGQSILLTMLLDTGADLTIVDEGAWPQDWPTKPMDGGVEGVGGHSSVRQSIERILFIIDGRKANTFVTVMTLPAGVNGLIGRDILDQLGVILTTERAFR